MAKKLEDPNNLFHYLMTTHAPLINKSIKSLRGENKLPPEEVMEDSDFHFPAMVGLMEAVQKHNPNMGDFLPYAEASIRGRIQSHADSAHEIPKHIRMKAKRFAKLYGEKTLDAPSPSKEQAPSAPIKPSSSSEMAPPSQKLEAQPDVPKTKPVDKSLIPSHLHDLYDQIYKKT